MKTNNRKFVTRNMALVVISLSIWPMRLSDWFRGDVEIFEIMNLIHSHNGLTHPSYISN